MDDRSILSHIHELVAEEKALRLRHSGDGLDETERERLQRIEVELDQADRAAALEDSRSPGLAGALRVPHAG